MTIILASAICNYFWEVNSCFLFSQNHLCYWIIFLALLYSQVPKIPAISAGYLFLAYQIFVNFFEFNKIEQFISHQSAIHHNFLYFCKYSFITILLLGIIGFVFKKFIKKDILNFSVEKRYFVYTLLYLGYMIIFGIFVSIYHRGGFYD